MAAASKGERSMLGQPSAPRRLQDPPQKDEALEAWLLLRRIPHATPNRPEDNYDISDFEEDEEGKRIEPDRTGKLVPTWCSNFAEVAKTQAAINPDSIFGSRVPRCDLEEVFPDHFYANRNPVKRRRGSSCHWFADRLTRVEVIQYAMKMGQRRRWSALRSGTFAAAMGAKHGITAGG